MIQELLGDAGLLLGDRKISFNNGGVVFEGSPSSSPSPSLSPSPISSSTTTITTTTTSTTIGSVSSENLRCPRCDSSNTKFCYYNNYNLTQPRHFCKTCRRYWTKGGALRNIPIGGGCRKSKSTTVSNSTAGKTTSAAKAKTTSSSEIIKSLGSGFSTHDQLPAASNTNTVLWGSPQNSQLLALLRATQNPNPNLMSNAIGTKDEGPMVCSHVNTEPTVATGALNARNLGLEPPGQLPIGLFGSLGWRNNQHHQLHEQHQPQQNSVLLGEIQNSGIQELYQRARSSSNNYYTNDHYSSQGFALTPNASSSVLEPVSGSGGELGYWNPPFSWSDLPTSNASFP